MNKDQINSLFAFRELNEGQSQRCAAIRAKALDLALFILDNTPGSPEQTLAVRAVHEASTKAVLSIAANE